MKFKIGMWVNCINDLPLEGNTKSPELEIGKDYEIKDIILDSAGNQHLDVGLPSMLEYVRSWETKEELPKGDIIHWCHPSRFKESIFELQ